jgi:hypothetical protein
VRLSNNLVGFIVPIVAAGLLAGCSGGGGSPSLQASGTGAGTQARTSSTQGAGAQSSASQGVDSNVQDDASCKSSGGVKVSPCPIMLTVSDPSQTVTVSMKNGYTLTEKDNCTKKGTATVAGSGGTYTITGGLTTGGCTAKFVEKSGKMTVGKATLPIKNNV